MKLKVLTFFIIFMLLISGLTACQSTAQSASLNANSNQTSTSTELYRTDAFYLYTQVEIATYGQLPPQIYREIWDKLAEIDRLFSMNGSQSEIAQINAAAGERAVAVSPAVYQLIKQGIFYSEMSTNFDISIGQLVQLWGIGTEQAHLPAQHEIDDALKTVDHQNIILDDSAQTVYLSQKNMAIDLGAIAKGYAADQTKAILLSHGVEKAIINFGGNVLTIGNKLDDSPWRIGIQNPNTARGDYLGILSVSDASVVTSGTYERFFEYNGKRYHHILSTQSGYPIDNDLLAVSIISDSSTKCDALSTLIFAEGLTNGQRLIDNLAGVEAIFITKDNAVYLSDGIKDSFTLKDEEYTLME